MFPGLGASLEALDFDGKQSQYCLKCQAFYNKVKYIENTTFNILGVNIGLSSSTRFNPAKPLKVCADELMSMTVVFIITDAWSVGY